jgi:hypothetical protein
METRAMECGLVSEMWRYEQGVVFCLFTLLVL